MTEPTADPGAGPPHASPGRMTPSAPGDPGTPPARPRRVASTPSLQRRQAQDLGLPVRPPLEADDQVPRGADLGGAPPLLVADPGGVVVVVGVEVVAVDLHEDHAEAVQRQPGVGDEAADGVPRAGDERGEGADGLAVDPPRVVELARAVDRLHRADLVTPEPLDITDAHADQHR